MRRMNIYQWVALLPIILMIVRQDWIAVIAMKTPNSHRIVLGLPDNVGG